MSVDENTCNQIGLKMCLSSRDARAKCSFRVEGVDERFPTECYVFLTVLTKMSSGFKDN